VLNNMGGFAYFEGRWNDAIDLYQRGRIAQEKTGDPVNAAYGTINIGEILSDQGRLAEAEQLTRQVLRVWRAAGDRSGVAFALSQLGRIAARDRRCDEALALYGEARAGFADVGDQIGVIETDARIAECLVFRGDAEAALRTIEESEARHSRAGSTVQGALLHRVRGYALAQLGRLDDARHAFDQSVSVGRTHNAEYEVALTLRALSQLARIEGSRAAALEAESAVILDRLGVVAVTDPPGMPAVGAPKPDGAVETAPSELTVG
jgi:tetratricopeptide (TPR) repeat protein